MIQDPTNQYIRTILQTYDLRGRDIVEIGCGCGRITRELGRYARRVLATDPNQAALLEARKFPVADSVEFILAPTGIPILPAASFDLVIYTLSLHHVPSEEMKNSLSQAAGLVRNDGLILVIEPGEEGSFLEAKQRFGIGSGDERPQLRAARQAMSALDGWILSETVHFQTLFQFADEEDFLVSKVPGYRQMPHRTIQPIYEFLAGHKTAEGIFLDSDRILYVLRRKPAS